MAKHLGVLAVDPPSILLVYTGRTGQSPLGQCADGDEAADDGVRVFVTLGHRLDERLVAVGGRLHGVVVVPGQHTRLEFADHLGALADRTNILGGHGTHAGHARLACVRVCLAALPVNRDTLRLAVLNVSRSNNGTHLLLFLGAKKVLGRPPASQAALSGALLVTLQKHLEFCIV